MLGNTESDNPHYVGNDQRIGKPGQVLQEMQWKNGSSERSSYGPQVIR